MCEHNVRQKIVADRGIAFGNSTEYLLSQNSRGAFLLRKMQPRKVGLQKESTLTKECALCEHNVKQKFVADRGIAFGYSTEF